MLQHISTILFVFLFVLKSIHAEPLKQVYRDDNKAVIKLNDEIITLSTHEGVVWNRNRHGEVIKVAAVLSSPEDFSCFLWTEATSVGKDFISATFHLGNSLKEEFIADRVYCYTRTRYDRTVVLLENDKQEVAMAFVRYESIQGSLYLSRAFAQVTRAAIVETEIMDGHCRILSAGRRSARILPDEPLLEDQYGAWGIFCFPY